MHTFLSNILTIIVFPSSPSSAPRKTASRAMRLGRSWPLGERKAVGTLRPSPGGRSAERRRVTAGRVRRPSPPAILGEPGLCRRRGASGSRRSQTSRRRVRASNSLARALAPPPVVAAKFEVDVEGKPILPTSRAVDDQSGVDAQANAPNADHGLRQTGSSSPRRQASETDCGAAKRAAQMQTGRRMSQRRNHRRRRLGSEMETRRLEPPPLSSLINRADIFARKLRRRSRRRTHHAIAALHSA